MALSEQTRARWEQKKRELAAAAPAEAAPQNDSIQQKWEQKKKELAMQRQQTAPATAKPTVKPSIAGASRAVTDTGTGGALRKNTPATPAAGRLTEEAFDRSPVLQERYGSYQRYAAQNKRYYARPELGGDTDRLRGASSTYETAARDALRAYEKAEEKQKATEETLEGLKQSLPSLQQSFQQDPSAVNNALYQTALQRYESFAAQYAQEAEDAQRLYGDYEQSLGKYRDALQAYRDYLSGEQERYRDWRSTIRTDENAIGRDLTAANAKVEQLRAKKEQLQRQAKQLMDKAYPRNSGTDGLLLQAQALQEQAREVDSRIQKAQSAADLLQEELDWKKYYQYADLMEAEDFAEKSRYVSTETGEAPKLGWSGVYRDTGFGDINYDIINRNETARGRQGVSDVNTNAGFLGLDHGEREQMTDDEIAIFNYLYAQDTARGDAEHRTAYEYIDYLTKELNYRRRQEEEASWKEYAKGSPVGSSAFSILTSPLKGLSYLGQAADYLGTGAIDQNAAYNRLSYANSAIRGQVSETIEQSGKWGKAGSFLYRTGMSMGDFLMNSLVTGAMAGGAVLGEKAFRVASDLSLAIMGTGAAADATIAAKDRGLTDKQAFTLGTIAGAAEVFTEKFSIEALLNGKWEDGAIQYILKNAFTEGSEEVGSDFINLFADVLIAKDKSEWRQAIDAFMAEGKTESEAFTLAVAQQAAEMGLDFLGGALSGGTMASVGTGIGAVRNQVQYRQDGSQLRRLGDEMTRGILEEAEALDPSSAAYKLGQRLKEKQAKGKRLTDAEIGRLYAETTRALEQTEQAAPQPAQDQPQQILGTELPTAEQTGGVMLPMAEQERQTAPLRETVKTAQPGVLPTAEQTDRRQRAARAQTETERTGILAGVNEDTIARVLRISSAVGREVVFFDAGADAAGGLENGHFDPEDGRIYINAQSRNPAAQIISHELTHSIEKSGSYGTLQRLVLQRIQQDGGDLQAMRQRKAELYARHGQELKASEVDAEIVAEYVEKHLLTDEQSIREMVRQDRTLGQRILDFIDRLLAKLGSDSAQERAFLTKARSYYRSALQETQSSFTAEMRQQAETQAAGMEGMEPRLERLRQQMASGEISDAEAEAVYDQTYNSEEDLRQGLGRLQHSYAGANANGANLEALREAQEMQKAGADMESIRRATGWHLGMEGKWRFEIDDSGMQLRGDGADLSDYTTLGELVDAPELFEAYPDMADLSVTFHTLEDGQNGGYSRKFDSIELSRDLKNRPEALLNSLIHEVQHAIQNREGFASGANPAYWNRRMENGFDSRTAEERREGARLQEQYEQMRESDPQFVAAMEELDAMAPKVPRGKVDLNTWEQIEPDPPEWVRYDERRDQLEEQYGDRVWDWYSLRDSIDRNARNGGRMPTNLYRDTAGEIEARDTAKRRELTTQERRETSPDYGSEDTVFADGGDGYAMSQSEQDSVKEQLREHQDALNNMKAVATIRDNGWKGMSTGAFRQKIVNDLKKTGYRVDNPSIGVIDFDEKLLNRSLNYIQTDAEAAAYQALPQVLKRGIKISGHGNHKGRDYETLTIAAPVELNGKRGNMAVVVMKTKGNRYKVHRILTPEGEAFALPEMTNAEPNTVGTVTSGSQSLGGSAPAISSASTDSVRGFEENVNTRYSLSEEEAAGDEVPAATLPTGRMDFGSEMRYNERTNEGGMSYGREMGNDNLRRWSDSQNTGERNRKSTGNGEVSAQRSEEARLGLYGGRSGEAVFTDDNEGRRLTSGQARQLQGTAEKRYDYTKAFADQVDDWKAGKIAKNDTLIVGPTPEVFQKIGFNALPVTINQTHVDYALNGTKNEEHHIGESMLKQLPRAMQAPVAVIASETQGKSSVVALLPFIKDAKTIIIPVYVDGFGRQNSVVIDSNAITSIYGRKNAITTLLTNAIEAHNNGETTLFYLDKTKATALYQVARVTMPKMPETNNGFVHSIREAGSPVNPKLENVTQTQQFKRWFGDWQNHPESASKVVNEDGTPKVVYHGTNEKNGDFTVFDESKAVKKSGLGLRALGKGNYFTATPLTGKERYGSRVIEAYLNIRNPLEVEIGKPFRETAAEVFGEQALEMSYDELQWRMREEGYDGVIQRNKDGEVALAVAFDPTQIKSATDNIGTFDRENPDIRYSVSEEEAAGDDVPAATLPTGQEESAKEESAKEESAKKQTEAEYQAERLGYPVLNGVQVVPMRTYVHATDVIRDENNNIVYEKDGKPRRRDNYGMVVGRSPYDADELIVAFRNDEKHTRKDEVFISIDDLEVALPRGDSKGQRMAILMEQEPVQPDNENMSAEDRAELNEMLNRAQAKEMARRAPLEELEPVKREEVTGKARVKLEQAERALVRRVGRALSVPRFAQREYLQEIAQRISEEYLTTGRVSEETAAELFEQAYQKGIVVDEEFYQQYKDIKEHLRTQAVTISEEDKHDIADWGDFRKSAFGRLRIVNQGGTPVDIAYEELRNMAPALFPYDISHPADQLVRMFEVAQSIEKTEKSLNEYYGQDAEEFKRWAKNDFDAAIGDTIGDLRTVKRYADERMAKADAAETAITPEQAAEAYKQLKKARWESEKAKAKNLLTEHDKLQLGRLLRGEIELQHLDPDTDNVKGIRAVYEATAEYERLVKLLTDYKKRRRAALLETADRYLETANDWKDKRTGLAYARETMERNFEDIVPDRKLAKEIVKEYITPVHDAEANATRFKTEYRDKVRALELSRKVSPGNEVSEAHAVQLLGEAMDNIRILENSRGRMAERDGKTLEDWRGIVQDLRAGSPNLDWGKINGAVESFRKIYDELFQRLNDVRVRNGYEPINYRSGYFPHFQPGDGGDGILSQFGRAMGIDTQVTALPTSINGLTHNFKPGITWFGNAQQRLGFNTAYDAVEGFDKYIEGAASVIFQTENIQKLRALATQMRYRTGDEGLRKQTDAVRADNRLTEEEKQSKIDEINREGRFVLSNFVNELDEYTNLLANKKSRFDRGIEAALGRRVYSFLKNWESRVGANMIAGNLSSALTNFIPLTQARGQIGRASMLKGMWDTLKAYRNDDGFADRSSFLTNRRGSDPIVKSWSQKASGILGKPMEYIDTFTADSIVRARYDQNIRRGLSEAEAMSEADAFAGKVMADRSKGSMPTLFESKNPIFKAFTQFQLEVNNQFSEVFKDLPRAYRDKGLAALAAALFKYFIGAFLFNEVYEYIVGRRPALDPIGLLNDTAGDLTGYALPNLVELGVGAAQGELPSFRAEKASLGETGKNLAQNALGELPFSSGLALLGADIDGGRVPAASAVPDLTALWDAATKEGWSGKRRWKEVQDELNKLAYIIPPFGGNQVQKLWKSAKALIEGGSYTVDADGSEKLQYPVFTDDPWETALNAGRMMLFGKNSLPTAQDWVEDNFNTLGAKQTAAYQDMLEAGIQGEDAFALLQELRGAEKTDEQSRNAVQREILRRSDVPGEGKAITYYALLASDRERELMDALDGADPGAVTDMLLDIKDANGLKGAAASGAKREAIAKAPLTDEEKQTVYRYVTGTKQEDGSYTTSREDDILAFRQAGLDFDAFLQAQSEYADINESYSGAGEKAMAFSRWVNSLDLTAAQAETVRDCFKYYSQIPAEAARYDSFVSAGLDDDAAYALADALNALEPEEGKKTVSNVQRYRAVIDAELREDEQLAALGALMQESEYSKLQTGYSYGVTPEAYVTFRELLPQYDADGNGTFNQKEVEAAIDSMGGGIGIVLPGGSEGDQPLTVTQQAVLWQLANRSWKPNKNPYSTSVGRKVYDALNAEPVSGGILLPDGTGGLVLPRG